MTRFFMILFSPCDALLEYQKHWLQAQLANGSLTTTMPPAELLPELQASAPALGSAGAQGHYVVANLVFSERLADSRKTREMAAYAAEARIQSFILGQLQGYIPRAAYLITRKAPLAFYPVPVTSTLDAPLDPCLAELRDRFIAIKSNGADLRPWRDDAVTSDPKRTDERWGRAKSFIARHPDTGADLRLLPNIGASQQEELAGRGYPDLRSLLALAPEQLSACLDGIKGIGPTRATQLRAVLLANHTQLPVLSPSVPVPVLREFEFYVDFEFCNNLNVDFEQEWPALAGRELIFMIGVGWAENGAWHKPPQVFRAKAESVEAEAVLIEEFCAFLEQRTGGAYLDPARTAIYHWSHAEQTQVKGAADRQHLAADHPLRWLPWQDLHSVFANGRAAVPGAWNYGLKEVAKALGRLDPQYDPQWVGDLDNGLGAMLLGWQLYAEERALARDKQLKPKQRDALRAHVQEGWAVLNVYLAADCYALWQVLRWLRTSQAAPLPDPSAAPYVGWPAVQQTFPPMPQRAYAGLNAGKGVVVYGQPGSGSKAGKLPVNHLIWGDELLVLETRGAWRKIRARNTVGWVHQSMLQLDPVLEVNFVDVGQGDGCFIVTPDRKYLLVDAGPEDHLYRFMRLYFAHFKAEVTFDAAIITHLYLSSKTVLCSPARSDLSGSS